MSTASQQNEVRELSVTPGPVLHGKGRISFCTSIVLEMICITLGYRIDSPINLRTPSATRRNDTINATLTQLQSFFRYWNDIQGPVRDFHKNPGLGYDNGVELI